MTRTARSRKHKGFDLEARLAAVDAAIERDPASWRGRWATWGADARRGSPWKSVHVDVGCGKGDFTVALAQRHPDVLFVGLDCEEVCCMHGAEKACAAGVANAVFALDRDPQLDALFAPGEVARIYLNFPAPFPKKKAADRRLTYAARLLAYESVLAPEGDVRLRTDSDPFLQYTRTQIDLARWAVIWEADDCRAARPDLPDTVYERKLTAKGARVFALDMAPGPAPRPQASDLVQTVPQSLYDYLPDDLESIEYIPHGMEGAVTNMRNYRRKRS